MKRNKMLTLIVAAFLAALFALPQAFAALQVTAFSCNGETGTITVPNNLAFTCTATINNPDDSTASLSSAKLYIDGSWATQSYSGSGFSTSLTTGASTTAVFTDVTATTPGSHKFAYILLDGVSDTFVADTVVNVMDIRVSRVRTNTSSAAQNEPFNVIAEISTGGAMSVTTTIDVSDCSLVTGEQASKTVGSLTEGAQTGVSWKLVMGANDCSYTVSVTGTGSGRVTDDVSGSVTSTGGGGSSPPPSGGTGGGGGGSGGGGGGTALAEESTLVSSIPAGSVGTFAFKKFSDVAVYEINFRANVNLENAKLTVKEARLSESAPKPFEEGTEATFKYFSVTREKVKNEEISDTKIMFKVPNSWLLKESIVPESVKLKKLVSNAWVSNPTTLLGESGGFASYEAAVEGLSTFAIVGEKKAGAAARVAEERDEEKAAAEKAAADRAAAEAARKAEEERLALARQQEAEEKPKEPLGGFSFASKVVWTLVVIIAAILAVVEVMHFMHRKFPPNFKLRLPKIPPPPLIPQKK